MIVDRQREKLVEAIIFFASRVRMLGKTKLFKLLYFLDFQHYRDTGRPVTGLEYFAWKMGPVPVSLFEELQGGDVVLDSKVEFKSRSVAKGTMLTVAALKEFDDALFSKRELRLLEELATEFRDVDSDQMVEATHLENLPWDKVWNVEKKRQAPIPYDYALRAQEFEVLKAFASERQEFIQILSK